MTALLEAPAKATETLAITVTSESIKDMAKRYGTLTINGVGDKTGLEAVHKARMSCVKARGAVDAECKALKEPALRECQRIDKLRRDLTAAIEAIEKPLEEKEKFVERETARLLKLEEDAKYKKRVEALQAEGATLPEALCRSMTESEFNLHILNVRKEKREREEAERANAAERDRLREEHERLIGEQRKLDEQRKLQAAEAERLKKLAEQTARPVEDIPVVPVRSSSLASPVDHLASGLERLSQVADLIDQIEIPAVCGELHDVRRTVSQIVEKAVVDIYAAVRTARK
jgi:hypothetical protein